MTSVVKSCSALMTPTTKNSEQCSLFLVLLVFVLLTSCAPQPTKKQQFVFSGPIMGTDYRVTVIYPGEPDPDTVEQKIIESMESVNQSMSHYLEDSEISIFNRSTAHSPQPISQDFANVLAESIRIGMISEGAFDITLAKVVNLWGFGPDGRISRQPDEASLNAMRDKIGLHKLVVEGNQLSKTSEGVSIDLSAIAKGYAVDKVADTLDQLGITNYLVNIGGELRASGRSISGQKWRVGIEKPHILGGVQQVAELENMAIATSGDYRNYHIIDDQHFSHTIDAKTLKPVFHKLALVSVLSKRASTADGLATALMAMGETRAIELTQQQDLAVYMLIRTEKAGDFKTFVSDKFKRYLQEELAQ